MLDALWGFALGFAVVLALIAAWKGAGTLRDALGTAAAMRGAVDVLALDLAALWEAFGKLRNLPQGTAVIDLAERLARLEQRVADIDLEVLDTAERVAHRLRDRERKRGTSRSEIGAEDEPDFPVHPDILLARAKASGQFPDVRQLPLPMAETGARAVGE